jgi:hypothetical protein
MITKLEPEKWLELNAKLQKKKSALRKDLSEMGILKREGNNSYDRYKYFSEAQYKELFTKLLPKHGLELNFNEVDYVTFTVEGKQPNGRMPKLEFYLYDTDTGFYEVTTITGEGIDKGDKAGYKAYTGALKYYLADKFMVATGDDPETESPEGRGGRPQKKKQSEEPDPNSTIADTPSAVKKVKDMINTLEKMGATAFMDELKQTYSIERIEDIKKGDFRTIMQIGQNKYDLLQEAK